MGRKKIATTVYLEPEQEQALRDLAQRTRRPAASHVREALEQYLPSAAREWAAFEEALKDFDQGA
jgi:predicted DNA-binding protein